MNPPPAEVAAAAPPSEQPSKASAYVQCLKSVFESYVREAMPEKLVRMLYAGAFGIFRVDALQAMDDHNLEISIFLDNEADEMATIVIPVEQCAIQFLEVVRTTETEREEKPEIGFHASRVAS